MGLLTDPLNLNVRCTLYTLLIIGLVLATIIAFFTWAEHQAKATHAQFQTKDVISALNNFISDSSTDHDEFDMFVSFPIDDPYLESIRQKALYYCRKFPGTETQDISPEGAKEIERLIHELQSHT